MSEIVGIVGPSGSGKSTSFRNLESDETFIINCSKKPLPFRGWKSKYTDFSKNKGEDADNGGNHYMTDSATKIRNLLRHIDTNREEIDKVIIDDCQYIMASEFMDRIDEKGWDKFNDMAKNMWSVVKTARDLSRDITVILTFHPDEANVDGVIKKKIKTVGKAVDNVLTLEGLFTVILWTDVKMDMDSGEPEFRFQTRTDGTNTCKAPMGMFENMYIPNDMDKVLDKIEQYHHGEQ